MGRKTLLVIGGGIGVRGILLKELRSLEGAEETQELEDVREFGCRDLVD